MQSMRQPPHDADQAIERGKQRRSIHPVGKTLPLALHRVAGGVKRGVYLFDMPSWARRAGAGKMPG
jgi:hypothetical protein